MKAISEIQLKQLLKKEFERGAKYAAEVARTYNSTSTHEYDLGDCCLRKLNLLSKEKVRENKDKIKK